MIVKEQEYYTAIYWDEIVRVDNIRKGWVAYTIVRYSPLMSDLYRKVEKWVIPLEVFRKSFKKLSKLKRALYAEQTKDNSRT